MEIRTPPVYSDQWRLAAQPQATTRTTDSAPFQESFVVQWCDEHKFIAVLLDRCALTDDSALTV